MLTAATALAADPLLPGRDALLDPGAMAERLSVLLAPGGPVPIDRCALVRAKYRIGESLRVVYRLGVGSSDQLIAARTFLPGTSDRAYLRATNARLHPTLLRPVAHDPELHAVWWTFPNDRRLRNLADLLDPRGGSPLELDLPGWCRSGVVEYAPERSATFRAEDADGRVLAYAKGYAPGTVRVADLALRYAWVAEVLARAGTDVRAPRPFGWSETAAALLLEPMPGSAWLGDGSDAAAPDRAALLGRALGILHAAAPPPVVRSGLRSFGRLDEPRLRRSAELVGWARPDLAGAAGALVDLLERRRPADPGEPVVLHGDCHPQNGLISGSGLALIDLDQAGLGPAGADLGSVLARLRRPPASRPAAAALLAAYAEVRPLPPAADLAWYVAAAMVAERSIRAVNRVHLDAVDTLSATLDDAALVLRDGAC